MGKDLYDNNEHCRDLFEQANEIIGFRITDLMFAGTPEDLKQTKVTQPAIFLHSVILAAYMSSEFMPDMVGGHSLGEFSALVATGAMGFEDGLPLDMGQLLSIPFVILGVWCMKRAMKK
jgi:[acyl-carrier-protein] S-malonyltransferase